MQGVNRTSRYRVAENPDCLDVPLTKEVRGSLPCAAVSRIECKALPRGFVTIRAPRPKALVVADRLLEPRDPKNPGGTDGRASVLPRTRRTSLVVLGRIDCAGAHRGTVESTNIPDPDAAPPAESSDGYRPRQGY
jgi:hypothetical protein